LAYTIQQGFCWVFGQQTINIGRPRTYTSQLVYMRTPYNKGLFLHAHYPTHCVVTAAT